MIKIQPETEFISLLRSNLKKSYNARKRKVEDIIHVSDIIHGQCLRKAYYQRVVDDYEFTDEDIDNFVRGESSEHVLVDMANVGAGQVELFFYENGPPTKDITPGTIVIMNESGDWVSADSEKPLLVARPDLLNTEEKTIVEFKDTKTFERLTPDHYKFKAYLRQLLYYLTISGYEKGVLCIRYASNRKLQWLQRDEQGDYYYSPLIDHETNENKLPELETWSIVLDKDSFVRELLKKEIKDRALKLRVELNRYNLEKILKVGQVGATKTDISGPHLNLPKVAEEWKCVRCPFLKTCDPKSVLEQDKADDSILDNFV